jgi:hypothetical protein
MRRAQATRARAAIDHLPNAISPVRKCQQQFSSEIAKEDIRFVSLKTKSLTLA